MKNIHLDQAAGRRFDTVLPLDARTELELAMTRLMPVLPSSAKLVLTVHDELVLECADDDAKIVAGQTAQVMKEAFREVFGDAVPAEVETRICENWGQKS